MDLVQNTINLRNMQNEIKELLKDKKIWIIGWKLKSSTPDFYMIFFPGELDKPLITDGIVLFSKNQILNLLNLQYNKFDEKVDLICDIDEALRLIERCRVDKKSIILNTINFLIDSIHGAEVKIPKEYSKIIFEFADHLTFKSELTSFFQNKYNRNEVKNSLHLLIGKVFANSLFYKD